MLRKTLKAMSLLFISLGFLLTGRASQDSALEGVKTGTLSTVNLPLKMEAVLPSPLGPSFALATGTIQGKPYGFLGSAAGLVVFDMSEATRPKAVGSLMMRGAPQGLFILGTYLFAAGGPGSSIVDVSEPRHPVEVQFLPTPDEARDAVFDATRKLALVVDFLGLRVIELSHPGRAVEVGALRFAGAPFHVTLDGARNLALVTGDSDSPTRGGSLRVIDVSTATSPVAVGTLEMPGRAYGIAFDAERHLALIAGSQGGQTRAGSLQLVDVSNPRKPAKLGTIDTPGGAFGVALDTRRQLAVVVGDGSAPQTGSLTVIDVSDASKPLDVGGVNLPSRALHVHLDTEPRLALVAGGHGLIIVRY